MFECVRSEPSWGACGVRGSGYARDPKSPLRRCSTSLQKIAGALVAAGYQISARSPEKLLRGLGFRLHANQTTREVKDQPDRDA